MLCFQDVPPSLSNLFDLFVGDHDDSQPQKIPIDERIRLVEDLWDSIAADEVALKLTTEEKAELHQRLDADESDGYKGRLATEAVADISRKL